MGVLPCTKIKNNDDNNEDDEIIDLTVITNRNLACFVVENKCSTTRLLAASPLSATLHAFLVNHVLLAD